MTQLIPTLVLVNIPGVVSQDSLSKASPLSSKYKHCHHNVLSLLHRVTAAFNV